MCYPQLVYLDNKKIDISGPKGNAYSIVSIAVSVLRQCGIKEDLIKDFRDECFSGDYEHLCNTVTQATGIQLVDGQEDGWL